MTDGELPAPPAAHGATVPKPLAHQAVSPRIELRVEVERGKPTERVVVVDGSFARIGSHPTNEIVLDDPLVSRFHCRLARERGAWRVTDTGSLNGTRILGMAVRDVDLPMPEAVLEVGDSRVRVRELVATKQEPLLDVASFGGLYGTSTVMRRLFAIIEKVAESDASVLIEGESGTGKELIAAEIVKRGPRAAAPFVVLDCGAIAANLIESTLFGHARGAFTGADRERAGAFEVADGGTVFLDEIGELPLEMQPKLLRVLEARQVVRLGESKSRPVDVRVVAATNRRLEHEINVGRFREDLYFRLSVVTLRAPPLRDRLEDLPVLVPAILEALGYDAFRGLFGPDTLEAMARHDWPGNVRELRNYVERAVVLREPAPIVPTDGGASAAATEAPIDVDIEKPFAESKDAIVAAFESRYVASVLKWANGNVSKAARKARVDRMTIHRLIARYDLRGSRTFKD
jgi:DNA-binding NtrC family response regulator